MIVPVAAPPDRAVAWTRPEELGHAEAATLEHAAGHARGVHMTAYADGHVETVEWATR